MAFSLKTWVNRISEYPNRRKLTHEDGSTELVTVARAEGQISAEGNAFSAEEMNDLENRIKGGFDEVNQSLANKNRDTVICRPETTIYDNDSPDLYTEFTCEQNPNDFNLFTAIVSEAYIQTPVYIKEWYSDTEDVINISSGRTIPTDKHNYQYFYAMITWERNQTAPYKIKVRRARQFFVTSTDGVSVEKIGFDGNLYIPVLQGIK